MPVSMRSGLKKLATPVEPRADSANAINTISARLFVTDTMSQTFLIDTGVAVSVVPPPRQPKTKPRDDHALYAANGTQINTYVTRTLALDLGLRRTCIIADVKKPIIGADFLNHHGLLDDIRGHCIIETLLTAPVNIKYLDLIQEFEDVTRPTFATGTVKHNVENRHYKDVQLSVLPDLCADLIIIHDLVKKHGSVKLSFGGPKATLTVCSQTVANVPPPSLFEYLSTDCKPVATKS